MKTPNPIPLFSLVCLLTVLTQAANTSLTNSHARRSIERAYHNHQRHAHSGPRRQDNADAVPSMERRVKGQRGVVDEVVKVVFPAPDPDPSNSLTSSSSTETSSSTSSASSTDSASSTSTDSASSTSTTDSTSSTSTTSSASSTSTSDSVSTTESVTSTTSATDSTSSAVSTDSTSASDSATATDSVSTPAVTDSTTTTATVSDPPASTTDSASPTITDPPATTPSPTASDPPASTTASCDPLDLICLYGSITSQIFQSDTQTSDSQVSTPAPTSDPPQTDSSTPTESSTPTATASDPPASTSDTPTSTSDIVTDIVNTLSSLLPTESATQTDLPTQSATESVTQSDQPTETATQSDQPTNTQTQSDQPTDTQTQSGSQTQTQSDQPTQTDTSTGTQTISQPPPTITDSFSDTATNTRTITGSDSPTDSATESATQTESVSFPTLTDSPTDSQPTQTATDSSASDSGTDSMSITMTTAPIPSEYSYITESSLALTSFDPTPSLTLTLTDPDAAFTTASLTQSGTAAPSQAVAFPTQLPTRIFPANRLDPDDPALDGMVLVSLKFSNGLTWPFVVSNSNTAALLFVYTPQTIANALGISTDQVLTFAMQAFAPADFTGDVSQLSTVYLLYIPAEQVDALQQQLLTQNSPLYTNQAGIPKQISQQLDATFPVNAVGLDTAIVGTGNTANGSNSGAADASAASRRDAIIGVCAAFGVILLAVVLWWSYKSYKRRQDKAHRRLTHDSAGMHQAGGYGATTQTVYGNNPYGAVYGVAPQRSGYAQPNTPMYTTGGAPIANPFEDSSYEEDYDERRRSFFYAEDSLRGFSVPREEDQGITYTQMRNQQQGLMPNDTKRRAPIQASAISAPILRESSLNW